MKVYLVGDEYQYDGGMHVVEVWEAYDAALERAIYWTRYCIENQLSGRYVVKEMNTNTINKE